LRRLPQPAVRDPNLLVGTETCDDAGVYRLSDDLALVQTLDFFPPVVDDPYAYGQIAAANSLSDVYAMGGTPKTALNLLGYPDDKDPGFTWLGPILEGAGERCREASCTVVGGHTVRDSEIKFGLSVTGIVHPKKFWSNAGAVAGDVLVLTKPLGTGFVTTAHRARNCPDRLLSDVIRSMADLNKAAALVAMDFTVHACTDVTGFGLAGHGLEMALGSGQRIRLKLGDLPSFVGVESMIRKGYFTRASKSNRDFAMEHVTLQPGLDTTRQELIFDPQTSGGLLFAVPSGEAAQLVLALEKAGTLAHAIIGEVLEGGVPGMEIVL
jgi:selenide,water dikinase